ncbi:hypothetical protein HPB47_017104 [Ixodes persulcatus]|uniref:Uncharacterized protein n=1 Tax=Ixodes persulcatus TaxID=34615 RepID=A0AC60QP66_IXOPE|nr:hypothetical protein HPB47_017104 [Ixodes persulcatus]
MGLLSKGTPFSWEDTKSRCDSVRQHGIAQFINLYHHARHRRNDCLLWGDEIEYMLVRFNHSQRKVQLLLRAAELIGILNQKERENPESCRCSWHPEFAAYAMEAIPIEPYGGHFAHYNVVEHNMRLRRAEVRTLLNKNEEIMCITTFPMMGCEDFTYPAYKPSLASTNMPSLFVPEEMIYPAHSRFTTMARNIRQRRGKRVVINAPIYKDINTPSPFEEDFRKLDDDGEAASGAIPDCIYMDAMGFGMGNCCLQVTFQASDISEAMTLYDQLANLCPLMLALGASSPAFRGHLANVDCRFNVISMSVDERTEEEMGKTTLRGKKTINRLRYSSIPCFLSAKNQSLNDISLEFNEKIYAVLREANVEEPLAKHLSHLFMKDSIVLYEEMMSQNNEADFDHFENLQSSNWHTLRFKPPPPNSDIGWRIEFRPMELQMTEFENAAYIVFVVLVTRIILTFDLDLTVPISKVDENMQTAQKVDAVLNEKFWFRKDIFTHGCAGKSATSTDVVKMTVAEIFNGKKESFPGFIPLIRVFLNSVEEVDVATHCTLHQYLTLIEKRASGDLMTTAHWMRKFITSHPEYKSDSVITDSINYDLIMRMFKHQHNFWSIPELLGMPTSRSSPE